MTAPRLDEAKLRRIVRAQFVSTNNYALDFQRAVHPVMKETKLSCVEAWWLVKRLRTF
jgi:hypothetical protein